MAGEDWGLLPPAQEPNPPLQSLGSQAAALWDLLTLPEVINPPTPLILSLTFLDLTNSSLLHSVFPKFHENLSITFYRAMHHSA